MKKKKPTIEPEQPTTFQIAQLAAILSLRGGQFDAEDHVYQAKQLWSAADFKFGDSNLKQLRSELFAIEIVPEDWEQRFFGSASGPERDLFLCERVPIEEALRGLFPAKSETRKSRQAKLRTLVASNPGHFKSVGQDDYFRNIDALIERASISVEGCLRLWQLSKADLTEKRRSAARSRRT